MERWHREAVVNAIERIRVSEPSEAARIAIQAGNELARARPPHEPAIYLAVRALFAVGIYHVAVRRSKEQNPLGLLQMEIQAIYERSRSGSAWRRSIAPLLALNDPLPLKLGVLQVLPENMNWRQPAAEALELLDAIGVTSSGKTNRGLGSSN